MGLSEAVNTCIRKFITFSGRAPRSEFWYWYLFSIILSMFVNFVVRVFSGSPGLSVFMSFLGFAISVAIMVVNVSVMSRRLHDIGKSGWWQLLGVGTVAVGVGALSIGVPTLLSVIVASSGIIVTFVWTVRRGTAGDNRFGPDPLAPEVDMPADTAFAGE
ncbi:MAG: DUF805 domain-containing protein [Rhodospirillaceae bacterium]|nr:DUF805 domain-containing protein [Rhodospirillaceae bacterium]